MSIRQITVLRKIFDDCLFPATQKHEGEPPKEQIQSIIYRWGTNMIVTARKVLKDLKSEEDKQVRHIFFVKKITGKKPSPL